jgi:Uma2 family endonuclease
MAKQQNQSAAGELGGTRRHGNRLRFIHWLTLPNGAKRSPDAAWVRRETWDALTDAQQEEFAPLCPDFVIEFRSSNDSLASLQEKMNEYMANGTRLGWLFDPEDTRVVVYRLNQAVECLDSPASISGDPVLPGFVFEPREIW